MTLLYSFLAACIKWLETSSSDNAYQSHFCNRDRMAQWKENIGKEWKSNKYDKGDGQSWDSIDVIIHGSF